MPLIPNRLSGGEDLRTMRPWLNTLRDLAVSLIPRGDGKTIMVQHTSSGTCLSAIRQPFGGGGGGDSYSGPFRIERQLQENEGEEPYYEVYIWGGIVNINGVIYETGDDLSDIGDIFADDNPNLWVVCSVSWDDGVQDFIVGYGAYETFPESVSNTAYFPLFYFDEQDDGSFIFRRLQYGAINLNSYIL